jgi:hypothetical protein
MTNLLIGYPDIPSRATAWRATTSSEADTPNQTEDDIAFNTFKGPKYLRWRSIYTAATHQITYDLGPGVTSTVDFIAMARIDNAIRLGGSKVSFQIQGSNDDSSYTTINYDDDLGLGVQTGPRSEDLIYLNSTSSAYRYFRFKSYTSDTANFTALFSNVYFGTIFDIGKDVDDYQIRRLLPDEDDFISSSGSAYPGRLAHPRYQIEITWDLVTDAKMKSFFELIDAHRHDTPCFLHTQTYDDVLNGHELLFCNLTSASASNVTNKPDQNSLTTVWTEDIG